MVPFVVVRISVNPPNAGGAALVTPDTRSDRLADAVRQRGQLVHVAVAHIRRDELGRPDEDGLRQQGRGHAVDAAALKRRELLLQALA